MCLHLTLTIVVADQYLNLMKRFCDLNGFGNIGSENDVFYHLVWSVRWVFLVPSDFVFLVSLCSQISAMTLTTDRNVNQDYENKTQVVINWNYALTLHL